MCRKVHLPLFLMPCVRKEGGRGLVNIRPIIRFAIRAAAAVRGSGRLKHGRRRH